MAFLTNFYIWGERGLVTTFFIDLMQNKDKEKILLFISEIDFPRKFSIDIARIKSVDVIIEPDFSNTGFGHPDAVFTVNLTDSTRFVFILEAKRFTYEESGKDKSYRGSNGFNSCLNGQLELNYCLTLALNKYKNNDSELAEPDWILNSPYSQERKGKKRCLKKKSVLKDVVSKLTTSTFGNYFHVILTNDNSNPFNNNLSANYLPELFYPKNGEHEIFYNRWNELKYNFGWINYRKLIKFIKTNESTMLQSSYFLRTFEINKGGLDETYQEFNGPTSDVNRPVFSEIKIIGDKGVRLIYAPSLNKDTFLHFSWGNSNGDREACAIRNYNNGNLTENREYKTSAIEEIVKQSISVKNHPSLDKVIAWESIIQECNKKYFP